MYCSQCGKENPDNALSCSSCGRPLAWPGPPAGPPKTSGMAVASLVLGILGFLCGLPAIPGLILGIVALSQISQSRGQLAGKGLAIAGICVSAAVLLLGLLSVVVITALTALGGHTRDAMSNVANTLGDAY